MARICNYFCMWHDDILRRNKSLASDNERAVHSKVVTASAWLQSAGGGVSDDVTRSRIVILEA